MITIEELSDAFYAASSAFNVAQHGDTDEFSRAIEMQDAFDEMLAKFQTENPDVPIFIDVINKTITLLS
ncbi:hypothetical protein [Klebsiella grimontii]|uniref:hypothetical protein n=1 Tax=Klebsiella grimontii TaxID=2058152 RepID=UPI001867D8A0|nr:hypothetical protein [Klebsiella grimontii]